MIRSYALSAIRSVSCNTLSGSLDLVGLTAALAISLLAARYVFDELRYDDVIPDTASIYPIFSYSLPSTS